MQISDLTVEVRDSLFRRVGQFAPEDLVGFTAVMRYRNVGSWSCSLPVGHRLTEYLLEPDSGIILSNAQGTLLSGPLTSVVTAQSVEDANGTITFTGVDDSVLLTERLAYPTPTTADVTAQTSAYDVRTGVAEAVMKAYIDANIGPSAPTGRRVTALTIEPSLGRGATITGSARFETLQELMTNLSDLSGLAFTIEQVGSGLQFQIYTPTDRSKYVRLDLDNNQLKKSDYSFARPKITRTIVAGQGDLAARTFIERTSAASLEAESVWGRRIESFTDQRNTNDLTQLQQAGDELLTTDGKTQIAVSITPTDDSTMLFGTDWYLGDKVTCVVGNVELQAVVSEVGLQVSADGVRLAATVGEPIDTDFESQIITRQANQATRLSRLERTK